MSRNDEMVLKFREVLRQTERFDAGDLKAYQDKLLEPLLLHARKHVPFYKRWLDAVFNGGEVELSRWSEIPLLTRADAQANEKRLRAAMVPPHLGAVSADETSGSTGRPLRYLKNDLMDIAALAMTDRLYRRWKFDGREAMAIFVSPRRQAAGEEGVETFGWRSGFPEGRNYLLDRSGDLARHLAWLKKVSARYMACYSAMVPTLAERARERGLDIKFDRVITRGGIVSDEDRADCEAVFGAALVDQYGADEIGQIACQCPHCGAYHISAEAVLVEILDDDGAPAAPGETGRVVFGEHLGIDDRFRGCRQVIYAVDIKEF